MNSENPELQELLELMNKKHLSFSDVISLVNNSEDKDPNDLKLAVDYLKTVDQAIIDGQFKWKDGWVSDIVTPQTFSIIPETIEKKPEIFVKLEKFCSGDALNNFIKKIDSEGYRLAITIEVLSFGLAYPDLCQGIKIIAAGSEHLYYLPFIFINNGIRKFKVRRPGDNYYHQYHFLVVRK